MVVLNKRANDFGRVDYGLKRKVFFGIDPANDLVVHQEHAFQDSVLAHQVLIGRDVIEVFVPLVPGVVLGQQGCRKYSGRSRKFARGLEEGTPVLGMARGNDLHTTSVRVERSKCSRFTTDRQAFSCSPMLVRN